MKKVLLLSLIVLLCIVATPFSNVFAQIPKQFSWQGYVRDENDKALNRPVPMTFAIYEQEFGGSPVWLEVQEITGVNGYVNAYLGKNNPFNNLKFDKPMWLQVTIGNGTPMPRTPLTPVPMALSALNAPPDGPAGGDLAGDYPNPSIRDGAVTQVKLDPNVQAIPRGAAGGDLDGTYPNPTLRPGAVIRNIAPGTITQNLLAPNVTVPPSGPASGDLTGVYPDPLIAPGAVKTDRIFNGAVTTIKIADGAVTTPKIADLSVTNAKIAPDAVTTDKIANATILLQDLNFEVHDWFVNWGDPAGGDLYGTYHNPQVGGLRNVPINTTPATNGQVYMYDAATNQWVATTLAQDVVGEFNNNQVRRWWNIPLSAQPTTTGELYMYDNVLRQWTPSQAGGVTATADISGLYNNLQINPSRVGVNELNAFDKNGIKPTTTAFNGQFMFYKFDATDVNKMQWSKPPVDKTSPVWNATSQEFDWGTAPVSVLGPSLVGDGTTANPIAINRSATFVPADGAVLYFNGAPGTGQWQASKVRPINLFTSNSADLTTNGYVLTWDNTINSMKWAIPSAQVNTAHPIVGNGLAGSPVTMYTSGVGVNEVLWFDGTQWTNGLINTNNIANGAVTSLKIADGTIAQVDMGVGSVGSAQIIDGTIVNVDIAPNTITYDKLNVGGVVPGTPGQALIVDNGGSNVVWGTPIVNTAGMLTGNGRTATPIEIRKDIANADDVLKYNSAGTAWESGKLMTANFVAAGTALETIAEPNGAWAGQVIGLDDATGTVVEWKDPATADNLTIIGTGVPSNTLRVAPAGITNYHIALNTILPQNINPGPAGKALVSTGGAVTWGTPQIFTASPIVGDGSTSATAITLNKAGVGANDVYYFDGTNWVPGKVGTAMIADGAITTQKIADGAVTTPKIADGAVNSAKILDNSVSTTDIQDGTIATVDIADNAVTNAKIAPSGTNEQYLVTNNLGASTWSTFNKSAKFTGSTVNTPLDIAANAITTTELADGAVTSAKIADGTIQNADLSANSVGSANIIDGSIVDADVNAAAAIAGTKINPDFGAQAVATTGTLAAGATTITGNLTLNGNVLGANNIVLDGDLAGGDLQGTYPNPTLAPGAVNLTELAPGTTLGQVMWWDGVAWQLSNNTAPNTQQVLKFDYPTAGVVQWADDAITIPFIYSNAHATTMFSLTNTAAAGGTVFNANMTNGDGTGAVPVATFAGGNQGQSTVNISRTSTTNVSNGALNVTTAFNQLNANSGAANITQTVNNVDPWNTWGLRVSNTVAATPAATPNTLIHRTGWFASDVDKGNGVGLEVSAINGTQNIGVLAQVNTTTFPTLVAGADVGAYVRNAGGTTLDWGAAIYADGAGEGAYIQSGTGRAINAFNTSTTNPTVLAQNGAAGSALLASSAPNNGTTDNNYTAVVRNNSGVNGRAMLVEGYTDASPGVAWPADGAYPAWTDNNPAVMVIRNNNTGTTTSNRILALKTYGSIQSNSAMEANTFIAWNEIFVGDPLGTLWARITPPTAVGAPIEINGQSPNTGKLKINGLADEGPGPVFNPNNWELDVIGDAQISGTLKAGLIFGTLALPNNNIFLGQSDGTADKVAISGDVAVSHTGALNSGTGQMLVNSVQTAAGTSIVTAINNGATVGTINNNRLTAGAANQVLVSTGGATPVWQALTTNATLLGNGVATPFGINLANANTWTGAQTFGTAAHLVTSSLAPSGAGTITANQYVGPGSTTNQVDLGTAEVAGFLPPGSILPGANGQFLITSGGVAMWSNPNLSGHFTGNGTTTTLTIGTGVIGPVELASTAVTAGAYPAGTAGTVYPTFTVDADGRLTAAGSQAIIVDDAAASDITISGAASNNLDLQIKAGVVGSTEIADGSIVDIDVNAAAGIQVTKLQAGAVNQFLVNNGTNSWAGLNINATLTGNGVGSALGINLANPNTWTGAQTFNGLTTFGGNIGSSLIPNVHNTYDLGTNALRWRDIYWAGTLTGGNATFVDLTVTGNTTLGDALGDFVRINGTISNNLGGTAVTIADDVFPSASVTYDLGSSGAQWRAVHSAGVNTYGAGGVTIANTGGLAITGSGGITVATGNIQATTGSFSGNGTVRLANNEPLMLNGTGYIKSSTAIVDVGNVGDAQDLRLRNGKLDVTSGTAGAPVASITSSNTAISGLVVYGPAAGPDNNNTLIGADKLAGNGSAIAATGDGAGSVLWVMKSAAPTNPATSDFAAEIRSNASNNAALFVSNTTSGASTAIQVGVGRIILSYNSMDADNVSANGGYTMINLTADGGGANNLPAGTNGQVLYLYNATLAAISFNGGTFTIPVGGVVGFVFMNAGWVQLP